MDHEEDYDDGRYQPISRGLYFTPFIVLEACYAGSCKSCRDEDCSGKCDVVYQGNRGKGKDKILFQGYGKGKCVDITCKKKEDCSHLGHSGFDCDSKDGECICKNKLS